MQWRLQKVCICAAFLTNKIFLCSRLVFTSLQVLSLRFAKYKLALLIWRYFVFSNIHRKAFYHPETSSTQENALNLLPESLSCSSFYDVIIACQIFIPILNFLNHWIVRDKYDHVKNWDYPHLQTTKNFFTLNAVYTKLEQAPFFKVDSIRLWRKNMRWRSTCMSPNFHQAFIHKLKLVIQTFSAFYFWSIWVCSYSYSWHTR